MRRPLAVAGCSTLALTLLLFLHLLVRHNNGARVVELFSSRLWFGTRESGNSSNPSTKSLKSYSSDLSLVFSRERDHVVHETMHGPPLNLHSVAPRQVLPEKPLSVKMLPFWKSFLAGSFAAIISGIVTHPIDLIKVRLQLLGATQQISFQSKTASRKSMSMFQMVTFIAHQEGLLMLYAGVGANLARQVTMIGTQFGTYDLLKIVFYLPGEEMSTGKTFFCGLCAGVVGALFGNPADLVMVRMQADGRLPVKLRRRYKGFRDAVSRIILEEGFFSLWQGFGVTTLRSVIVVSSQLPTYDACKAFLSLKFGIRGGVLSQILSSAVAGSVSAFASTPVDLVKSRLMDMKADPSGNVPYQGMMDCFAKTVREEGPQTLFQGVGPSCIRHIPLSIVRFLSLELLKKLFRV
mmetsp:Transcript_13501/g.53056  ORF Transcript_13501/g.53056 Transcript_13501/m.53056 type:complete len:407 (+) Transcript_13501:269-1489(+)